MAAPKNAEAAMLGTDSTATSSKLQPPSNLPARALKTESSPVNGEQRLEVLTGECA
jgi:hypothetical protein